MKTRKTGKMRPRKSATKKYDKPVSLWPLKPEDALRLFMQINRAKIKD